MKKMRDGIAAAAAVALPQAAISSAARYGAGEFQPPVLDGWSWGE